MSDASRVYPQKDPKYVTEKTVIPRMVADFRQHDAPHESEIDKNVSRCAGSQLLELPAFVV